MCVEIEREIDLMDALVVLFNAIALECIHIDKYIDETERILNAHDLSLFQEQDMLAHLIIYNVYRVLKCKRDVKRKRKDNIFRSVFCLY